MCPVVLMFLWCHLKDEFAQNQLHHKWSGSINSASLGVDGAAALASWNSPGKIDRPFPLFISYIAHLDSFCTSLFLCLT